MKKNYIKRLLVFFTVIIIFSLVYIPLFNDLKFGLDLKGGFEVLYQVKRSDGKNLKSGDLNSTYDVLKRNVDSLGVSEPEITIEGDDRIRVKLAGVTDIEGARKALSNVANVSFRDTDDKLLMDASVIKGAKLSYDENGKPKKMLSVLGNRNPSMIDIYDTALEADAKEYALNNLSSLAPSTRYKFNLIKAAKALGMPDSDIFRGYRAPNRELSLNLKKLSLNPHLSTDIDKQNELYGKVNIEIPNFRVYDNLFDIVNPINVSE